MPEWVKTIGILAQQKVGSKDPLLVYEYALDRCSAAEVLKYLPLLLEWWLEKDTLHPLKVHCDGGSAAM